MIEIKTQNLKAVSTHELLKRLEWIGDTDTATYKMIVLELNSRGIKAEMPSMD